MATDRLSPSCYLGGRNAGSGKQEWPFFSHPPRPRGRCGVVVLLGAASVKLIFSVLRLSLGIIALLAWIGLGDLSLFILQRDLGTTGGGSSFCVWEDSCEKLPGPRFSWWTLASVEGVCVCRNWFNRSAAAQGLDLRCYPRNRGRGVAGLWCPCLEDLYQGVWGPDPCTVLPRWRLATAQGIPFPPGPGLEGPFHPQPWGSSEGRASLSSPPGVLHLWRPAGSPSMAASQPWPLPLA